MGDVLSAGKTLQEPGRADLPKEFLLKFTERFAAAQLFHTFRLWRCLRQPTLRQEPGYRN